MIAALVPFRGRNFARELLLRKLEQEVRAERRPAHVVDVMNTLHSAPIVLRDLFNQRPEVRCAL